MNERFSRTARLLGEDALTCLQGAVDGNRGEGAVPIASVSRAGIAASVDGYVSCRQIEINIFHISRGGNERKQRDATKHRCHASGNDENSQP